VEVVLGIQFLPLAGFSAPYYGVFWQRIKHDFPQMQVQQPIITPQLIEADGGLPVRVWFLNENGDHLLQLQGDRLILNWRKIGASAYPRYETMKPHLLALWETFVAFLAEEGISQPKPLHSELTYLNHIDLDAEITKGRKLEEVFAYWAGGPTLFLEETLVSRASSTLVLPDGTGQITVSFQPAVSLDGAKQVTQLVFTTHMGIASASTADVGATLDRAHDLNIRAFREFITDRYQQEWGRYDSYE
jgi:uncharacterized protein (TIGR04255 family)